VTYSNEPKREMLGVRAATLARHGASARRRRARWRRGLEAQRAQVAVAVTGVAGPGRNAQETRGMVCFAWSLARRSPESIVRRFRGGRESVRRQSVAVALRGVLDRLR